MKSLVTGLLVLFGMLFAGQVNAMIETISLEELIKQSEIVAVATLKVINKHAKDQDGWVRIDNTIVLQEILKGTAAANEEVVIETLEGLEDMPKFEPRKKFLVFLQKDAAGHKYLTTNMIQGCWPLDANGEPLGMGTGVTRKQVEQVVKTVGDQKPSQSTGDVVPTL
jgi:hypothetical protein